jgi:hypothetical protein
VENYTLGIMYTQSSARFFTLATSETTGKLTRLSFFDNKEYWISAFNGLRKVAEFYFIISGGFWG